MPNINCLQCGEEKHYKPSEVSARRFCSRRCGYDWKLSQRKTIHCSWCHRVKQLKASEAKRIRFCSTTCWQKWRRKQCERSCRICGKTFLPSGSVFKGRTQTCSRKCGYILERRRSSVNCLHCGNTFDVQRCYSFGARKRKYCSWLCYRSSHPVYKETVKCCRCRKKFLKRIVKTRIRRFSFCSQACRDKGIPRHIHPLFRGNRKQDRGEGWRRTRRKILIRDNRKCCICSKNVHGHDACVDHIVPYILAQIRRDKINDGMNLLLMCRACHSRKTTICEPHIIRGDLSGFVLACMFTGISRDAVVLALNNFFGTSSGIVSIKLNKSGPNK